MRVVFLCGALDELTRHARNITAANPAATLKVLNFCRALRRAGHRAEVLSLGRGRQDGSGASHAACARHTAGVPVVYARFVHNRLTHLISAISTAALLWRLRRRGFARQKPALIAYNRLWHYVPALLLARLLGMRCFLDLEDGHATLGRSWLRRGTDRFNQWLFDHLCSSGVLLANVALGAQTTIRHRTIWYGILPELPVRADWSRVPLGVILGGTLHEERGCRLFIDAVRGLIHTCPQLRNQLQFYVTGHGPMQAELAAFAGETRGWVTFAGLAGRALYLEILARCQVGLMLNLSTHEMSRTTFPSKVLEYAAAGLLVISTPVSDIAAFFHADAALLLAKETPDALAQSLTAIVADRNMAAAIAARGRQRALDCCDEAVLAPRLASFLMGNE